MLAKIACIMDKGLLYKGNPMLNEEETNNVVNRLKSHPEILESIRDLLDITELMLRKKGKTKKREILKNQLIQKAQQYFTNIGRIFEIN